MKTAHLNYPSILAITPILALLDGFAIQAEPILSLEWKDNNVVAIEWPCGKFEAVQTGPDSYGWLLTINDLKLRFFNV